jgi:toxin ParE1/3/4
MKVVLTEPALSDLESISTYLTINHPAVAPAVRKRIQAVLAHIGRWPDSARRTSGRRGVRILPLGKYPYRIFYRVTRQTVEVLHIHHAARQPWAE